MRRRNKGKLEIGGTMVIAAALAACLTLGTGCSEVAEAEPEQFSSAPSDQMTPQPKPVQPDIPPASAEAPVPKEAEPEEPATDAGQAAEAETATDAAYVYVDDGYYGEAYCEPSSYSYDYSGYGENGPTREMPGYYDGHRETYYSSNVLYHYMTPEWTVDEEGFYRTDEGYYVVGVSYDEFLTTRPLGTVIETGKGEAIVMDTGITDQPTVDFYTAW